MDKLLFDEAAQIVKMVTQYLYSEGEDLETAENQYSTLLNNVSNRLEKLVADKSLSSCAVVSLGDSQPVQTALFSKNRKRKKLEAKKLLNSTKRSGRVDFLVMRAALLRFLWRKL